MVGVAVAEHQAVQADLAGLQQGHQHAVARVALQAVARPGVVEQRVGGGAHQHRIALAHVGG